MVTDDIGLHYLVRIRMGNLVTGRLDNMTATNNGVTRTWFYQEADSKLKGKVKIFMNYNGEKVRAKKLIEGLNNIFVMYKRPNGTLSLALESEFRQNATLNEDKKED